MAPPAAEEEAKRPEAEKKAEDLAAAEKENAQAESEAVAGSLDGAGAAAQEGSEESSQSLEVASALDEMLKNAPADTIAKLEENATTEVGEVLSADATLEVKVQDSAEKSEPELEVASALDEMLKNGPAGASPAEFAAAKEAAAAALAAEIKPPELEVLNVEVVAIGKTKIEPPALGAWARFVSWLQSLFARPPEPKEVAPVIESFLEKALRECVQDRYDLQPVRGEHREMETAWFELTSALYSGHVVVTHGEGSLAPVLFLSRFRETLLSHLSNGGVDSSAGEAAPLRLMPVDCDRWMDARATVKGSVSGSEFRLFVGLFPFSEEEKAFTLRTFNLEEYFPEPLIELECERGLEFDVFLFLPLNGKYIRYIRSGDRLEQADKDRLLSRGVSQAHLKFADLQSLSAYRVRRRLNRTIAEL
jgi:hypothetical protein